MPLGDRPPEPLSRHEVRALLDACDPETLAGIRNNAMIVVMWRAGLRCSEVLALRLSDIDFEAGTIRVRFGKGRRARTVGVDDQALDVIGGWAQARSAAGFDSAAPLFCTVRGRDAGHPMNPRYVRALMTRLGRVAGVDHRVHPHGFRHTMAVEMVREAVPVTLISRQLGHSSVAATQFYVDHLHPADVVAMGRARSW